MKLIYKDSRGEFIKLAMDDGDPLDYLNDMPNLMSLLKDPGMPKPETPVLCIIDGGKPKKRVLHSA